MSLEEILSLIRRIESGPIDGRHDYPLRLVHRKGLHTKDEKDLEEDLLSRCGF